MESIQTTEDKDTSSKSGNDAHADDADIRPTYDEEPMVEDRSELEIHDTAMTLVHVSKLLGSKVVPTEEKTDASRQRVGITISPITPNNVEVKCLELVLKDIQSFEAQEKG
ncbi:hypothetical protein Tco_1003658 [Tanacetum coccineum]|uniref:Uncharacterized protein n=1 Tax=Tanacetum coccineum TaxID=301880 RepID=A0ABQ5FA26_9ASTR